MEYIRVWLGLWLCLDTPTAPPPPGPALPLATHRPGWQLAHLLGPLLPLQLDTHSTLADWFVTRVNSTGFPWHSLALMTRLGLPPLPLDYSAPPHLDTGALLSGSWYHKVRELIVKSVPLRALLHLLHLAVRVVLLNFFILDGVGTLGFKSRNNDT